jgi:16S rRNA (adenine1518-N6/adenine1519-N6)-dimethyltransferase
MRPKSPRSGWRPSRRLGQNFLVDRRAAERIVEALSPLPGEKVLEIGPGRGALTAGLIEKTGRIAAVEVDETLANELAERFDPGKLVLLREDILAVDFEELRSVSDWPAEGGLVVAGNLPYAISKPLAMKLIEQRSAVERAVLMFQREVADRLTARPGSKSYGPLGVLAGLTYSITRLFDLPFSAFRPRPRVVSSVTMWRPQRPSVLEKGLERRLRSCLAASFARRRGTLYNNLRKALGKAAADELLKSAGIEGSVRAEALSPEVFMQLARAWKG